MPDMVVTFSSRMLVVASIVCVAIAFEGRQAYSENVQTRLEVVAVPIMCLPASAYPDLPNDIAEYMKENSLLVPQYLWTQPDNVICGRFCGTKEKDWAVLATDGVDCFVLVFPAGRVDDVQRLWTEPLCARCQGNGDGTFIFSRSIDSASPEQVRRYAVFNQEPLPFEIDHDGIDDHFVEKASTVRYCRNNKWEDLPGAD